MKKRIVAFLGCLLMAVSITGGAAQVYANNHEDKAFSFSYTADGSDIAGIAPRAKKDNTATYIKSNKTNPELLVSVAGTNKSTSYSGINPNRCSGIVVVPSGSYKYISNSVYGNYKYAYLVTGTAQTEKTYTISGKWSPDNISNRY